MHWNIGVKIISHLVEEKGGGQFDMTLQYNELSIGIHTIKYKIREEWVHEVLRK
jgi:hypothetical protein